MTHRRPRSPGSFQDELGGVIERIVPKDRDAQAKPNKPEPQPVKDIADLNERLFEKAWRKSD